MVKQAEQVQILELDEGGARRNSASTDNSIAVALARHGIKPTVGASIAGDISGGRGDETQTLVDTRRRSRVGDAILSRLADMGRRSSGDGRYGHSRIRELVFGGVTRHIARPMLRDRRL